MALILGFISLKGQTNIPAGNVSGTWTKAHSPYLIQGNILVAQGTSLVIEPGVKVEFKGAYALGSNGLITAVGTPNEPIVFTSTDTVEGWLGIRFNLDLGINTPTDTCRFVYCNITHGRSAFKTSGIDDGNTAGGAFYLRHVEGKFIIANSYIADCKAQDGSAIFCTKSSLMISNNTITKCNAAGEGTICLHGSDARIQNNNIVDNTATDGAGIYVGSSSSPLIIANEITRNTASDNGGGIAVFKTYSVYISKNNITLNSAKSFGGGGVYVGEPSSISKYLIVDNIISNNSAPVGGGLCVNLDSTESNNSSSFEVTDNVIVNNSSNKGGGFYLNNAIARITNNTIANNAGLNGGGIFCNEKSDAIIKNSIIYGNTAQSGNQIYLNDEASDPVISYSDIQGGTSAFGLNNTTYTGSYTNNMDTNPSHVNPTAGSGDTYNGYNANWRLNASSPCINAGDQNGPYFAYDIAGNIRVYGNRIDLGAYESLVTGIKESADEKGIKFYPNPSNGVFSIDAEDYKMSAINVYNVLGACIYTAQPSANKFTVDLHDQPEGVYFVTVYESGNAYSKKIIIK